MEKPMLSSRNYLIKKSWAKAPFFGFYTPVLKHRLIYLIHQR